MSDFTPSGHVLEMLARIGGVIPSDLQAMLPTDRASHAALIVRMVRAMPPDAQAEFLARYEQPWTTLLLANDLHPDLGDIVALVRAAGGEMLLLAGPLGPPPPAVVIIERDTDWTVE